MDPKQSDATKWVELPENSGKWGASSDHEDPDSESESDARDFVENSESVLAGEKKLNLLILGLRSFFIEEFPQKSRFESRFELFDPHLKSKPESTRTKELEKLFEPIMPMPRLYKP